MPPVSRHAIQGRLLGLSQSLGNGFSLLARSGGQYMPDKRLPSGELWYLGGSNTLPACEMQSISRDSGLYWTGQLRSARRGTPVGSGIGNAVLLWIPHFLDAGVAFNDYVKGQPLMTYEDGGFGLDFEIGGHLSGDLSVAWPIDPNSNTQAVDDPRFLFYGDVDLLRFSHANQHRLQCPMLNMRFVPAWRTPDYVAGIVVDVERVVLCSDSGVEWLFFFRVIK